MDAECCCAGENGVTDFDALHSRMNDGTFAYAFDLLALDGADVRRLPLRQRREMLAKLLRKAMPGIRLSEPIEADGASLQAENSPQRRGSTAHAVKLSLVSR